MLSDSTVTDGTTYLVTDPDGRVRRDHDGLYHDDTRHLDAYDIALDERPLEPLEVHSPRPGRRDVHLSTALEGGARALSVRRAQALDDGLFERLQIENLTNDPVSDTLEVTVGTGFQDLFEVRGAEPLDRTVAAEARASGVSFGYEPTDVTFGRETHVTVDASATVAVTESDPTRATLEIDLDLAPGQTRTVHLAVRPDAVAADPAGAFADADAAVREREQQWYDSLDAPTAAERDAADVIEQSLEDLLALRLDTEHGPVLAAGTPWFATVFGRDSLLAAYQVLPLTDGPARGTLRYLAAHQATETDDFRESEPGKIFHEIRHGELSVREMVPHSPYYGTIDATALWVVLLEETWQRTGDDALVTDLWENLTAALEWLETHGDADGDGFLEYGAAPAEGESLRHQAWKDSDDGIMHGDGSRPEGPIAPAEVQGYYYDALVRAATLHEEFGDDAEADRLRERAADLAAAFDDRFWLDDRSFYAVALDGENQPVDCVTTNPGHCLWSGIVPEEKADTVVDRLLAEDMFSGWGIRTVSSDHDVYNPQSYHLGSVWPHDNSLIVLGMVAYGRADAARTVTDGLFEAAIARGNDRLPELFAGFDREATTVPIEYGVACEPQAWAAAAPLACRFALAAADEKSGQERYQIV